MGKRQAESQLDKDDLYNSSDEEVPYILPLNILNIAV